MVGGSIAAAGYWKSDKTVPKHENVPSLATLLGLELEALSEL
jgi:hypothetical protein